MYNSHNWEVRCVSVVMCPRYCERLDTNGKRIGVVFAEGWFIFRTIRVPRVVCVSPTTDVEMQSLSNHLCRWWRSCGRRGRNAFSYGIKVFWIRGAAFGTNCSTSFCRSGVYNRIVALRIVHHVGLLKQPKLKNALVSTNPMCKNRI